MRICDWQICRSERLRCETNTPVSLNVGLTPALPSKSIHLSPNRFRNTSVSFAVTEGNKSRRLLQRRLKVQRVHSATQPLWKTHKTRRSPPASRNWTKNSQ